MKAIVQSGYGDPDGVLELRDVEPPPLGGREVLVRVHASSVNPADRMTLTGRPYALRPMFGLLGPRHRIPGKDMAGSVEAVGAEVTELMPGDRVYAELRAGAFAEYAVARADLVARMPGSLDFVEAASIPLAGVTALQGMRDAGGVRAGHRVLVNGASGGVGTFAVQIARSLGAHVTGVCRTRNVDLVRSLGADEVVDYTRADFTEGGERYDAILDLIGNHPVSAYRRILNADGVYVAASGSPGGALFGPLPYIARAAVASLRPGSRQVKVLSASPNAQDLTELTRLFDAGELEPTIDRTFDLTQAADALAHQLAGHARGKTVVTV